jgi:hypothetical protein
VTESPLESQPRLGRIRASGLPTGQVLGHALEPLSATQELCESRRGQRAHRDEGKEGKNRLALPHVHLGNLPDEARVPTKDSALVLSRVTAGEKEGELECFRQPDDLEFGAAERASVALRRSRARRKRM